MSLFVISVLNETSIDQKPLDACLKDWLHNHFIAPTFQCFHFTLLSVVLREQADVRSIKACFSCEVYRKVSEKLSNLLGSLQAIHLRHV